MRSRALATVGMTATLLAIAAMSNGVEPEKPSEPPPEPATVPDAELEPVSDDEERRRRREIDRLRTMMERRAGLGPVNRMREQERRVRQMRRAASK